jgi:Protein of unknown function (DUF3723)
MSVIFLAVIHLSPKYTRAGMACHAEYDRWSSIDSKFIHLHEGGLLAGRRGCWIRPGYPCGAVMASPFEESQEIDKETLFFDVILGPVGEPGEEFTWPFVRRCFFVAFFGTFDDTL